MPKPKSKSEPGFNPTQARIAMEKTLREFSGTVLPEREEKSMDYFYKAVEATTADAFAKNLTKALEFDPGNVDALLLSVELMEEDEDDRILMLRAITEIAAQRLGEGAFRDLKGEFWGFIETRPYMRVREQLAACLRAAGRLDEAIVEYEAMLELNEGDNQGIRYSLLPGHLMMGNLKAAQALMKRYKNDLDWSVVFAWCKVLERFLSKDEAGTQKALEAARKQNPHVEAFLTGKKKPPAEMPPYYSSGSLDEAVCYVADLLPLWNMHPEAKKLLATPARPVPAKSKPKSKPTATRSGPKKS